MTSVRRPRRAASEEDLRSVGRLKQPLGRRRVTVISRRTGPCRRADPLQHLPESCGGRRGEFFTRHCGARRRRRLISERSSARRPGRLLHSSARRATALGPARPLLPVCDDLPRHFARADERELEHTDRSTAIPAGFRIWKRPVADQAGADGITPRPPLGPPRHTHRARQLGGPDLAATAPGAERELGDDVPAHDVCDPAATQPRIRKRGEDAVPNGREALRGQGLDLEGASRIVHGQARLGDVAPRRLEAVRDRRYRGATA